MQEYFYALYTIMAVEKSEKISVIYYFTHYENTKFLEQVWKNS